VRRWLRAALLLLLRSPFRFGLLIALLGCLDTAAVNFAEGYVIQEVWVDRLGIVALPLLWVLVSAVARGADDHSLTRQSISQLCRRSVWIGALSVGVVLATLSWFLHSLSHGFAEAVARHPSAYLQRQGELLASIEAAVVLIVGSSGLTYCPLLVFVPDLSPHHAITLSRRADKINGVVTILIMTGILAIGDLYLAAAIPLYGMTTAAFLVFFGVLAYVAFRDVFEGRSENLAQETIGLRVARAGRAMRSPVS
jgi:hypothetical protein